MSISNKTVGYIIYLLRNELPEVYAELPKHDLNHTNDKVDYSVMILENKLKVLTPPYKDALIDFINRHDADSVRQILYGLSVN
jgi:hypothetical protein